MIDWTIKSLADVADIVMHLLQTNPNQVADITNQIGTKANWLIYNAMTGSNVRGLDYRYRKSYAVNMKYIIYYKILGTDSIKIMRVRSSKQRPLRPDEIEP